MNKPFIAATAVALMSLMGLVYVVTKAPVGCGSDHCVKVEVTTLGGPIGIAVDSLELHVHGRDQVIFWNLANTLAQSYKFSADGIKFTGAGASEFACQRLNDYKFKCTDTGTPGVYKYVVTLSGEPSVYPLDPWIYNE